MNSDRAGVRLWYLPPEVSPPEPSLDGCLQRLTEVTPELIRTAAATLDRAKPALSELGTGTIVEAIDRAIRSWQDAASPYREALFEHGPALTGFSLPLLQHAVDVMLAKFNAEGLWRLLAQELGDPAALDRFVRSGGATMRLARGPGRQFQVLAGGVPTVGIFSMVCALLVKSPALVKPSAHDLLFPSLFAQTVAYVEPRLAQALAVMPWSGGSGDLDEAAMEGAGVIVVYGTDATVEHFRRRAPRGARFVGYGHHLSAACVARESLTTAEAEETVRRLAWDVALFDQQGCLSPQFAAVECGGVIEPRAFAERLAGALATLAVRFPRGSLSPGEATHIQSLRDTARFQSSAGAVVALWESPDSTDWTVVYRDGRDGLQSCRNRFITIVPVSDLRRDMIRLCPGLPISTIGVAASMERMPALADAFAPIATRICRLGSMGEPPITWRHDGQTNLGPLVTWVDLEVR